MSAPISVCTLAIGRAAHLRNLVRGLAMNRVTPDELVIAVMQDEPYDLPETPFPIRQLVLGAGGSPCRPPATAAREAANERLVFLDIDCIPDPDFVADYMRGWISTDGIC